MNSITQNTICRYALTISILILFTITFNSCSKQDAKSTEQIPLEGLIKVVGEDVGAVTKTTLNGLGTSWVASTDKVGIYSSQARPTSGGLAGVKNIQFTARSSGASSLFDGTMYWGTGPHDFYSYYPYKSGTPECTSIPVSLVSAQTQTALNSTTHIEALDFLIATPITMTPGNIGDTTKGITFRFNHLFTLVEFQIIGSEADILTKVSLSAPGILAFSAGSIDITQVTPAQGIAYTINNQTGTTGTIVVSTANTALSQSATRVYMMVNPSVQTGNCTIGLFVGGVWKDIIKPLPAGGFKRGSKYAIIVNSEDATTRLPGIGDSFGGGKIAYLLQPGESNGVYNYDPNTQHGLIAAISDQGATIAWYNGSNTLVGSTLTSIGTGLANTTAIINSQGNSGTYAAKICRDFNGGGFNDWFLPSKDELNKLYLNKAAIGGFVDGGYWSSSESSLSNAWLQNFTNGNQGNYFGKYTTYRVRAVRAF